MQSMSRDQGPSDDDSSRRTPSNGRISALPCRFSWTVGQRSGWFFCSFLLCGLHSCTRRDWEAGGRMRGGRGKCDLKLGRLRRGWCEKGDHLEQRVVSTLKETKLRSERD